jgi:hypothetical protein
MLVLVDVGVIEHTISDGDANHGEQYVIRK